MRLLAPCRKCGGRSEALLLWLGWRRVAQHLFPPGDYHNFIMRRALYEHPTRMTFYALWMMATTRFRRTV